MTGSTKDLGWDVIPLAGDLNASAAERLRTRLRQLLSEGCSRIVADLRAVESLDSAALSVLVATQRAARSCDGDLALAHPSESVRLLLEVTQLDSLFEILDEPRGECVSV